MKVLGMISGTSHDGIDAAVVDLTLTGDELHRRGRARRQHPVPARPAGAAGGRVPTGADDLAEVCELDTLIGQAFAEVAAAVVAGVPDVELIVSHGQTVFHWVEGAHALGTLQLGQAAWIAERTGVPVVSDVRIRDITAGGHGAPLVSYLDTLLLAGDCRAGGGAEPRWHLEHDRRRPGRARLRLRHRTGERARRRGGGAHRRRRQRLRHRRAPGARPDRCTTACWPSCSTTPTTTCRHRRAPARSTSTATTSTPRWRAAGVDLAVSDLVATLTELTVRTVARDVAAAGVSTLVVSGGGCHNPVVMAGLRAALPGVGVVTSDDLGVPADAKEAIAFAILGWCTLHGRPGNVPAATGASGPRGPRNDHARSPAAAAAGAGSDAGAEPADGRSRIDRHGHDAVTLRDARPDDLDGIVAVFLGCWHVTYAEALPAATVAAMTPAGARALWSRVLGEGAPGEVIVADARRADGGTAIAGVTRWSPSGWVHSLYVDPAAQGTGVGSQLLAEATRRIGLAGAATAHLWVFRDNAAGRRFYGRHGWSPDGTTRVEEEFGAPELRLTRPLERPPRHRAVRRRRRSPTSSPGSSTGRWRRRAAERHRPASPWRCARSTASAHVVAGRRSVDTATTTARAADGRHTARPGVGHQDRRHDDGGAGPGVGGTAGARRSRRALPARVRRRRQGDDHRP